MFGNIIKKGSATFAKFFNQPAFAVAGGKTINNPPTSKNFIDYTNAAGQEDTATQRKYEKEMHEAAKRATAEINEADEQNIQQRIRHEQQEKLGQRDVAFEKAEQGQRDAQTGLGETGVGNRQWEKWVKQGHDDNSRFYEQAKDSAEKKGNDWAKSMESKGKMPQ